MDDDSYFRWIMVAGAVAVLPAAVYFRIRSMATGERLDRRQEGWFLLLRPLGIVFIGAVLAYLIYPPWMAWSSVALPTWLRWVGVAIGAAAAGLLIWTFRTLGPNLTDTVVTRREHTLVTGGPYRWIRHPFYVAFLLATVANALVATNWFLFVSGVTAFVLLALRSRIEEANLAARFGDDYQAYRARTGKFWPRRHS